MSFSAASANGSRRGSLDISGGSPKLGPRKFHNGWSTEQEKLMAEWADKAQCYRWLHDRCEKRFSAKNLWISIPVIVLSTLSGTANFAIDSLVGDDSDNQKYAQAAIGGVSLFAGMLTTIGNYLRYAQGSESHRMAGIAWGKFQRQIAVELALHPNERIDCMDFLKICRAELDRLIEQSPPIPDDIIAEFEREFPDVKDVKKPEICKGLEHTRVFQDTNSRMKQLSSEAALILLHKKKMLRQEIVPDIQNLVGKEVEKKIELVVPRVVGALAPTLPLPLSPSTEEGSPKIKGGSLFDIDYRRFVKPRLTLSGEIVPATSTKNFSDVPSILSAISSLSLSTPLAAAAAVPADAQTAPEHENASPQKPPSGQEAV